MGTAEKVMCFFLKKRIINKTAGLTPLERRAHQTKRYQDKPSILRPRILGPHLTQT